MNILILSWRDPKHPLAGGAEQVTHEHAKGWVEAGYKVYLFSSSFEGCKKEEMLDGIQIVRGGHQYLGVQLMACLYYFRNRSRIDLVLDQFHGLPFFTPFYINKPKIANIYETASKVWFLNHLPKPFNFFIGTLGFILEPLVFHAYKNINFIVVSNSTKTQIQEFGIPKKNVQIIPAGVIVNTPKTITIKGNIPIVTYLGMLSKDKGIEDALKCFSLLCYLGDFRFWVIGRPQTTTYGKTLKKMVQKPGISKKIKFWGYVPKKDKFRLLAKSHILINPSVREGWGLVNIEANSVGTPVIAYSSPGLVDSVRDGVSGILCKQNTPLELANNILNLLHNPQKYSRLQKGALAWSKKFTWERSRKMSLKLIEKTAIKKSS